MAITTAASHARLATPSTSRRVSQVAQVLTPAPLNGPSFPSHRAEAPVAWNDTVGFWALSRHAEVHDRQQAATAVDESGDTCRSPGKAGVRPRRDHLHHGLGRQRDHVVRDGHEKQPALRDLPLCRGEVSLSRGRHLIGWGG